MNNTLIRSAILAALAVAPALVLADAAPAISTLGVDVSARGKPVVRTARVESARDHRVKAQANESVELLFADGSSIVLAPGSELIVREYAYDRSTRQGTLSVELVSGASRISGGTLNDTQLIRLAAGDVRVEVDQAIALIERGADGAVQAIMLAGKRVGMAQGGVQRDIVRTGYRVASSGSQLGVVSVATREDIARMTARLNPSLGTGTAPNVIVEDRIVVANTEALLRDEKNQGLFAGAALGAGNSGLEDTILSKASNPLTSFSATLPSASNQYVPRTATGIDAFGVTCAAQAGCSQDVTNNVFNPIASGTATARTRAPTTAVFASDGASMEAALTSGSTRAFLPLGCDAEGANCQAQTFAFISFRNDLGFNEGDDCTTQECRDLDVDGDGILAGETVDRDIDGDGDVDIVVAGTPYAFRDYDRLGLVIGASNLNLMSDSDQNVLSADNQGGGEAKPTIHLDARSIWNPSDDAATLTRSSDGELKMGSIVAEPDLYGCDDPTCVRTAQIPDEFDIDTDSDVIEFPYPDGNNSLLEYGSPFGNANVFALQAGYRSLRGGIAPSACLTGPSDKRCVLDPNGILIDDLLLDAQGNPVTRRIEVVTRNADNFLAIQLTPAARSVAAPNQPRDRENLSCLGVNGRDCAGQSIFFATGDVDVTHQQEGAAVDRYFISAGLDGLDNAISGGGGDLAAITGAPGTTPGLRAFFRDQTESDQTANDIGAIKDPGFFVIRSALPCDASGCDGAEPSRFFHSDSAFDKSDDGTRVTGATLSLATGTLTYDLLDGEQTYGTATLSGRAVGTSRAADSASILLATPLRSTAAGGGNPLLKDLDANGTPICAEDHCSAVGRAGYLVIENFSADATGPKGGIEDPIGVPAAGDATTEQSKSAFLRLATGVETTAVAQRTGHAATGYAAALVEAETDAGVEIRQMASTGSGLTVTPNSEDNSFAASLNARVSGEDSEVKPLNFGGDAGAGTYLDDSRYGATSITETSNAALLSAAAVENLPQAIDLEAPAFTRWGFFFGDVLGANASNPDSGGRQHVNLGFWVAGTATAAADMPKSGGAKFSGNVLASVYNPSAEDRLYATRGNFEQTWNFAARAGELKLQYDCSAGGACASRYSGAMQADSTGVNFGGTLISGWRGDAGFGASSTAVGSANGNFVSNGATPAAGVIGQFNIANGSTLASGVFAGVKD